MKWGDMQEKSTAEQHSWLIGRAFIRHIDLETDDQPEHSCIGLRGYDEAVVATRQRKDLRDGKLASEMHGILQGLRDRNKVWDDADSEPDPKDEPQEVQMNEVKLAAARQCLDEEVVVALHDWYEYEKNRGPFDSIAFLNKICRASGRPEVDEEMIHRYSRSTEFDGFVQFVDLLVMKFPQVQDMTAWDVRRFAELVDHEEKDSARNSVMVKH